DPLIGTMTMTDEYGNVMMAADTSMTRADQADFGHLDLVGNLEGTVLDLNTDWAMADFGVDDDGWGPQESLNIRFFDADYDVYINFSIEQAAGSFGVGTFLISDDFNEPVKVNMWARYMVDGVGFVDQQITSEGWLTIDYWDGIRAAGSFTVNAPHEMTGHFDLPFTEEADFF
ncbi:MAG: hypothetical protein KAJ98_00750, partial [Spirochaetaceae bacterium]|nr:hypothetical protein [Spirochaetaceae bacterium]